MYADRFWFFKMSQDILGINNLRLVKFITPGFYQFTRPPGSPRLTVPNHQKIRIFIQAPSAHRSKTKHYLIAKSKKGVIAIISLISNIVNRGRMIQHSLETGDPVTSGPTNTGLNKFFLGKRQKDMSLPPSFSHRFQK